MAGLRELWDLGDPTAPAGTSRQQVEHARRAFTDAIASVNASLQFIAAHAPQTSHEQLARRRHELFGRYQQAINAGEGNPRALQEVVARAEQLREEAAQLAHATRDLKQRWEQQAPRLESAEDLVAQAPGEVDETAPLRQGLDRIAEAAKLRDYQAACDELETVVAAAQSLALPTAESPSAPGGGPAGAVNEQRYELQGGLPTAPVVPTDPRELKHWQNPLITDDPRTLFAPERMDGVVDMHFAGEGTPQLNEAMKGLLFAQEGADVSAQLAEIGRQRGLDPQVVEQQYARFKQVQEVARQLEAARGLPPDEALTSRRDEYLATHGEFLGTQSSLRFGQVVGEATGLDPAFAALLNPTGGMVGPGMDVLAPTDADSPIIWHGIFHDAGGYLLNYQNSGPGYTYLQHAQPESGRRGADPLQGQVEGVSYWYERRQPERLVLEDLYEPDLTAEDPEAKQLAYDRFVRHPIDDAEAFAAGLTDDAVEEVREMTRQVREQSRSSMNDLKSSTHAAAAAVGEQVARADAALDRLADKARDVGVDQELVDAAEQSIRDELQQVQQQVDDWDRHVSGKFDEAGAMVEENLQAVDRWADEAGAAVHRRISEVSDEMEQEIHDQLLAVAQDQDLQDTLRRGANFVGETKQDVEALVSTVESEIEDAKQRAEQFYQQAVDSVGQQVDRAAEELVGVKNDLIDKLDEAQQQAAQSVARIEERVDRVAVEMAEARQDLLDAAGGVADSLADAVESGTDTLANTLGSATDFAAERLDRLTNLLG
jgi:hypothetical protein